MNINMLEKEATSSRHSREHKAKHRAHDADGEPHAEREHKHKKRHRHDEGEEGERSSSKKHHKHHKKDKEKEKTREGRSKDKHHHRSAEKKMDIVDDNPSDDNMWVENDIGMDGERVRTSFPSPVCSVSCALTGLAVGTSNRHPDGGKSENQIDGGGRRAPAPCNQHNQHHSARRLDDAPTERTHYA